MPVMEAVQTFVGIANENEFYSHYLSEVLKGDIKSAWNSGLSRKRPIPSSEHHTSSWPAGPVSGSHYATPSLTVPLPQSSSTVSGTCSRGC